MKRPATGYLQFNRITCAMVTPGDTRNDAAASLENSIERNGEEGSEVADLSPPRSRKNRVTSDNEVDLLENDFRNLSPAVNRKKSKKSVIEFKVGDMIDYWAPATIVFVASNLRTGIITEIYSDEGWDESDNMHDSHLMVGTDPITYGALIRPINTEKWIRTCSRKSCKCVEGVMKMEIDKVFHIRSIIFDATQFAVLFAAYQPYY